jgi:hypothetical protein
MDCGVPIHALNIASISISCQDGNIILLAAIMAGIVTNRQSERQFHFMVYTR